MRWMGSGIVLATALCIAYLYIDKFDPESVRGKKVLITGSSTGIGEQIAYHYARLGASVVVTARTEFRLQRVVERCKELGPKSARYGYVVADMAHLESYEKVVKAADTVLGGLDVVILNHILPVPLGDWNGRPENLTLMQTLFDVNFRAYVHIASHAVPRLEKTKGSIVVVSSVAGKIGLPYIAPYSGSKFALDGFFSSLRQELRMRGSSVSVTLCVIGFIATENALLQMRTFGLDFLLQTLHASSPEDAALAIIQGSTLRQRELYFPYMEAKLSTLARDWVPEILEAFIRYLYAKP